MSTSGIKNIIEAIIFASDEEVTAKEIKDILDTFKIESNVKEIEQDIELLNTEYANSENAFEIIKISGGYQFATKKKFAHFIGKLYTESQRKKLSPPAIETLSIIAYKQPITRNEIEFIRGVNVDYIVNSLLERDLITIKGRADGPGRPILYGTTTNFLKVLGLNSLEDLPRLKEINEILKTEKIEGITEADIDLFNSVNNPEVQKSVPEEKTEPEEVTAIENIDNNAQEMDFPLNKAEENKNEISSNDE